MSRQPGADGRGILRRLGWRLPLAAAVLLVAIPSAPLQAQDVRSVEVKIENDGLVLWTPPDERDDWYYTHGMSVSVVEGGRGIVPEWGWRDVPGCAGPRSSACLVSKLSIGQKIFTPSDLFVRVPRIRERPYAGWLYVGAGLWRIAPRRVTGIRAEVGITGKASLAGTAHMWLHEALDKPRPRGWDAQLPFEVAAGLRGEWVERLEVDAGPDWSIGVEPGVAVTLGTVRTSASAGVAGRLGWNAPRSLELGLGAAKGFYVLARGEIEAEAVARDLFIDGSTWTVSESGEKISRVDSRGAALFLGFGRFGLRIAARRTGREFVGQPSPHSVGSVTLVWGM